MRSALVPAATLLTLALVAAGCASPDQAETTSTPTPSPSVSATPSPATTPPEESPEGVTDEPAVEAVPITIRGDEVQPNGRRVEVAAGEPFTLAVDSDRAAELHVHSTPEQTLQIEPGRSEVPLTVDTPGLVDVEEHDTGIVVLQLEVR